MLRKYLQSVCLLIVLLCFQNSVTGQRIAVLTPDETGSSRKFAELLEPIIGNELTLLDDSLSHAAYSSVDVPSPFNMTTEQSVNLGKVIGCDVFILVRSATMRRSAFGRPEYYEAFAAVYIVSSRTGQLAQWRLQTFEAQTPTDAQRLLNENAKPLADEIIKAVRSVSKTELIDPNTPMEEPPDAGSPAAKGFRPPVPYRRIKPEYTTEAALYDVTATVEILVDLDATGSILRTRIVRWAGYGLDESVERAVRKMNWRPAERNGRTLPMRFLLRYNFKKADSPA
jgi:TonB family protein